MCINVIKSKYQVDSFPMSTTNIVRSKKKISLHTFKNAMSKTSSVVSSTSFQHQINSFTMFEFLPCNLQIVNLSIFVLQDLVSMDIPSTSGLTPHNCVLVWNCQNTY